MSKRSGKNVVCGACGKVIWASPSTVRRNEKATGRFFCSADCSRHWRYGTEEGRAYFSVKFKAAAARGSTDKAHAATRGKPTWNKGVTAALDKRMARAARKRMETMGGAEGLARKARLAMIKNRKGFYTDIQVPERQEVVLEMAGRIVGRNRVSSEHFMVLPGERPIFVDVAIPSALLAIEVDGTSHSTKAAQKADRGRDAALVELGWRVLRIKNDCVDQFPDAVEKAIRKALES